MARTRSLQAEPPGGGEPPQPPAVVEAGAATGALAPVAARRPAGDVIGLGRARAVGFVTPALALIGVFLAFPALYTVYIGITNYRLTGKEALHPQVVWLENFTTALSDVTFYNAVWLTVLFVFGSAVLGQNLLGFTLAWALRAAPRGVRRTVETLVLLAWILPGPAVAFLWFAFLGRQGGTLNMLLGDTGEGTAWLIDYPVLSIIVFNIWRGTAFSLLLYGAALTSVPPSHLETAKLAGASRLQTLRDAVFPHIRAHVLTNTLLISLWTFNDFTPFLLTGGGPFGPDGGGSEIIAAYIYRTATVREELGYASAISLLVLVVNLVLALAYLRMLRRRAR